MCVLLHEPTGLARESEIQVRAVPDAGCSDRCTHCADQTREAKERHTRPDRPKCCRSSLLLANRTILMRSAGRLSTTWNCSRAPRHFPFHQKTHAYHCGI